MSRLLRYLDNSFEINKIKLPLSPHYSKYCKGSARRQPRELNYDMDFCIYYIQPQLLQENFASPSFVSL